MTGDIDDTWDSDDWDNEFNDGFGVDPELVAKQEKLNQLQDLFNSVPMQPQWSGKRMDRNRVIVTCRRHGDFIYYNKDSVCQGCLESGSHRLFIVSYRVWGRAAPIAIACYNSAEDNDGTFLSKRRVKVDSANRQTVDMRVIYKGPLMLRIQVKHLISVIESRFDKAIIDHPITFSRSKNALKPSDEYEIVQLAKDLHGPNKQYELAVTLVLNNLELLNAAFGSCEPENASREIKSYMDSLQELLECRFGPDTPEEDFAGTGDPDDPNHESNFVPHQIDPSLIIPDDQPLPSNYEKFQKAKAEATN